MIESSVRLLATPVSRVVGCCLIVLMQELHIVFPHWGAPTMKSVRRVWGLLHVAPRESLLLWLHEINHAY